MTKRIIISLLAVVLIAALGIGVFVIYFLDSELDPYIALYEEQCSTCHGERIRLPGYRHACLVGNPVGS
jgi:hypothetical protein